LNLEYGNNVYFIDGPGGTGKTFLYTLILAFVRSNKQIALATASSGIASLLLPGGRTAHSRFKIPIKLNESSTCNVYLNSHEAELLQKTKLIVWDEAPMMHRYAIEALDRTLRDIMKQINRIYEEMPFGNKIVLFGGDFRQILPVIPNGTEQDIVNSCLKNSQLWSFIRTIKLTINMRVQKDNENDATARDFVQFLLRVGEGKETALKEMEYDDYILIPCEFVVQGDEEAFVKLIFPNINK
jgi:hypothetical protein